ncbi:MAG: hypothetical protein ACRENP_09065 [Longimicrobiales bacterium]
MWFLGIARSNTDLARIARAFAARFMVYVARNPTERQAVNWNTVIQLIDQSITSDFTVLGTVGVVESSYKNRAARQRTTTPGDFMRVDYRLLGPSDVSQGFVGWYAQPWAQRTPFRMQTIDRRIDGLTAAERPATCAQAAASNGSCGFYMGYHNTTVFNADRGLGQRSFYFFHRYGQGTAYQSGPIQIINVAELELLKAEGLIRLGRSSEALALINKYRANGQLAAITVDGVPGTAQLRTAQDEWCLRQRVGRAHVRKTRRDSWLGGRARVLRCPRLAIPGAEHAHPLSHAVARCATSGSQPLHVWWRRRHRRSTSS